MERKGLTPDSALIIARRVGPGKRETSEITLLMMLRCASAQLRRSIVGTLLIVCKPCGEETLFCAQARHVENINRASAVWKPFARKRVMWKILTAQARCGNLFCAQACRGKYWVHFDHVVALSCISCTLHRRQHGHSSLSDLVRLLAPPHHHVICLHGSRVRLRIGGLLGAHCEE